MYMTMLIKQDDKYEGVGAITYALGPVEVGGCGLVSI